MALALWYDDHHREPIGECPILTVTSWARRGAAKMDRGQGLLYPRAFDLDWNMVRISIPFFIRSNFTVKRPNGNFKWHFISSSFLISYLVTASINCTYCDGCNCEVFWIICIIDCRVRFWAGWTVPKTRFKPAFYCPKLSKTAQNRPKLSETANWLQKCQIDTWTDIKFAKFKLSNAWKNELVMYLLFKNLYFHISTFIKTIY